MNADARTRGTVSADETAGASTPSRFGADALVVLLRPRRLRGTRGVIRRRVLGGWEVEIRSPEGTPLHLTLPERALHLRA